MSKFAEFLDSFRNADGTDDIQRVVENADFPVYVLRLGSSQLKLFSLELAVGTRAGLSVVSAARFNYVTPLAVAGYDLASAGYDRALVLWSAVRNSERRDLKGRPTRIQPVDVANVLHTLKGFWTKQCQPPFDWRNLDKLWKNNTEFIFELPWEGVASDIHGLACWMVHYDEPAQVSLMFCDDGAKGCLTIGGLGMPREEFLATASSVVPLQSKDPLIDPLQDELRQSYQELTTQLARLRGLS